YNDKIAEDAVMVLPKPTGILSGKKILNVIEKGPRWESVEFEDEIAMRHGSAFVLAYEAHAKRGKDTYRALCSSTYCEADEGWKLIAHNQVPV
ncbi:MAG: nuclear transport factor 2 family protein, partial [Donghicola eburneus]